MSSHRLRESVLGVVGGAAQNYPLPRRVLFLPNRDLTERIEAGSFYEINHARLPPDAPIVLYSLRAVMVTTKTEQTVTIRFPSIRSLEAFFAKSVHAPTRLYPSTDEKYVMEIRIAVQVLSHQISSLEFVELRRSKAFWLINTFQTQQVGSAAVSNAKNGTCFSMLQHSGMTWGHRRTQLVPSTAKEQHDDADEAISAVAHGDDKDILKEEEIHQVEAVSDAAHGDDKDILKEEESRQVEAISAVAREDDKDILKEEESRQVEAISAEARGDDKDILKEEESRQAEAVSAVARGDDKDILKEEEIHEVEVKLEESPDIKLKDLIQYSRKRKFVRPVRSQYKIKGNPKQKQKPLLIVPKAEGNKGGRVDRWSTTRYEAAAKDLVEVLKANKASYGNPVTRPTLRAEARKRIGDTGLLDHLLKHLAGKVVPSGGDVRLRRKCDADGKMEYWLESADLVKIRNEAGVKDPYWTPPPGWKPGDCINAHNCICCNEVRLLKDELSNLRGKLTEVKLKDGKQQPNALALTLRASSAEMFNNSNLEAKKSKESYELLVKKKSAMEEQLHKMSKALMELEEDMKKLSSKKEAGAKRKPLRISYSKNWTAEENGINRTNTEEFAEETSEESSNDDDDEDYERESKVRKTLRPIRLRACRLPPSDNKISHAVDCAREDLLTVTPSSASPHSTTTS